MTKLEEIAQAIGHEYFGRFETRSKIDTEWCARLARTAVEAMREPSQAMLAADTFTFPLEPGLRHEGGHVCVGPMKDSYCRMIDAVLNEKESP